MQLKKNYFIRIENDWFIPAIENVKDANKHLIIVETFVENDILFKEISELIYEL